MGSRVPTVGAASPHSANAANIYSNSHYKYLEPMTLVGLFFLLVSVPSAIAAIKLERRFSTRRT